jgi:hypothetical protein
LGGAVAALELKRCKPESWPDRGPDADGFFDADGLLNVPEKEPFVPAAGKDTSLDF